MFYPCIYLYSGCYGFSSVPTGLSALPAPLHFDAFPLVGLDCTGEHVQLVSEHSSFCLGNETLKKHLHENAIKSFFFHWIVQAVFRDEGSKCSVKATQYGMDRGWGTEVGRSTPNAVSIEVAHLTYIIQALCFNSAFVIWWNTLTPKTQALFIAGLKQSVFCSMYQYNMQQFFFYFLCRWMRTCKNSSVHILQDLFELLVIWIGILIYQKGVDCFPQILPLKTLLVQSSKGKQYVSQIFNCTTVFVEDYLSLKNSWKDVWTMSLSTCAVVIDFKQYLTLSPELLTLPEHAFTLRLH